jgi:hypothetical protein
MRVVVSGSLIVQVCGLHCWRLGISRREFFTSVTTVATIDYFETTHVAEQRDARHCCGLLEAILGSALRRQAKDIQSNQKRLDRPFRSCGV